MGGIVRRTMVLALLVGACVAAPVGADELPSAFSLGQLDWTDQAAVRAALGPLLHKGGKRVTFADEEFERALLQGKNGQYQAAFVKHSPTAEGFKDRFVGAATNVWGAPVEESTNTPDLPGQSTDYVAAWQVANTSIKLTVRKIENNFIKVDYTSVTFQSAQPASPPANNGFAEDMELAREIANMSNYLQKNPKDNAALEFRAQLFFRAGDLDKAWADVAVIRGSGGEINERFDAQLRDKSLAIE